MLAHIFRSHILALHSTRVALASPALVVAQRHFAKEAKDEKVSSQSLKPKRPPSAYTLFVKAKYKDVDVDVQGLEGREASIARFKALAATWRAMDEEDRQPYVQESKLTEEKYRRELAAYLANPPPGSPEAQPKPPKRPRGPHIYYMMQRFEELKEEDPDLPSKDILPKAIKEWRDLDEDSRAPYLRMAEKDSKRYEAEKLAYLDATADTQ